MSVYGTCHVCHHQRSIKFCHLCDHWFCGVCQYDTERIKAFIEEVRHGRVAGCCGPVVEARI